MDRGTFLYRDFLSHLDYEPTSCQDRMLRDVGEFVTSDKVLSSYAHRPAFTVHKHIYRQKSVGSDGFGQFSLSPNKAKDTLFVVDEVSLVGIEEVQRQSSTAFGTGNLLEDLIRFVRSGVDCRLILVGDAAQLPPVGLDCSPALSKEYMEGFGGVRFSELTTVVRQAQESGILRNATMLRERISSGSGDDIFEDLKLDIRGFDDVERLSGGELIEKITDAYSRYGEDETVILCRSNKRAIRYNLGIRNSISKQHLDECDCSCKWFKCRRYCCKHRCGFSGYWSYVWFHSCSGCIYRC